MPTPKQRSRKALKQLRDFYNANDFSAAEIAENMGFLDKRTVSHWLHDQKHYLQRDSLENLELWLSTCPNDLVAQMHAARQAKPNPAMRGKRCKQANGSTANGPRRTVPLDLPRAHQTAEPAVARVTPATERLPLQVAAQTVASDAMQDVRTTLTLKRQQLQVTLDQTAAAIAAIDVLLDQL